MEMNYCMQCGTKLQIRHHPTEGEVPFCETCDAFRYPVVYRSGHNGPDSKSGNPLTGTVGSNPTASAFIRSS